MGKHSMSDFRLPPRSGTDRGTPFSQMTAEEKAQEFDASDANPLGYAQRNFDARPETEQTRHGRIG